MIKEEWIVQTATTISRLEKSSAVKLRCAWLLIQHDWVSVCLSRHQIPFHLLEHGLPENRRWHQRGLVNRLRQAGKGGRQHGRQGNHRQDD